VAAPSSIAARWVVPAAVAIVVHGAAFVTLRLGRVFGWGLEERPPVEVAIEIDEVIEPPPEPEPAPEPEPEPTPEPPPEPATEPPPTPREATPPPEPTAPPPPDAPPPAPGPPAGGEPVPGWLDGPPGQPFQLGEVGPAGTMPVQAPGGGGGAKGTGGGGGGPPDSTGDGPVSIASIKTMPVPIGDTDFVEARRDYPAEASRQGIEGAVKVKLLVDATGAVTKRTLITRLGHGLDELALKLAARLRFEPAKDDRDRPVPATVVWTFTFTLPR
jgi:TonB family protein